MALIFLVLVGTLYLLLGVWCLLSPHSTAGSMGLMLQPGTGESEYFAVYGGLQVALAIVFLLPLIRDDLLIHTLLVCLILHASLTLFRTLSFILFSPVQGSIWIIAAGEWLLFLVSLVLWLKRK